ncbi:Small heat shock protein (HSP20) [Teratosphaeria destructans]|uniref:Small heat shock protein (HSP20) n=1 Tax=Teratosphaeria destructans TaxID=418781 RepID=A0A9W7SWV6_9PEZI|nr:Small heat shock protein (HSP20) [Teratosphaeria destructans]
MSLFPRFIDNEFAPVFRLLDAAQEHALSTGRDAGFAQRFRSFQPKFDVKETKETYELHGELPGVEQKNINIEFTDAQTLTIKGRTEHTREEGQRPSGWVEGESKAQGKLTEGEHKAKQPTVEDENQANSNSKEVAKSGEQKQVQAKEQARYWVSERSVGEFARTFSFPTRVDQDKVKASLKDGILSVIVPKAPAPTSKRINIE